MVGQILAANIQYHTGREAIEMLREIRQHHTRHVGSLRPFENTTTPQMVQFSNVKTYFTVNQFEVPRFKMKKKKTDIGRL